MDCMTRDVQREAPWDKLFADDVVVCSETLEEEVGDMARGNGS